MIKTTISFQTVWGGRYLLTSCSWQRQQADYLYRALQQHVETARIAIGEKGAVVVEASKECCWRDLLKQECILSLL